MSSLYFLCPTQNMWVCSPPEKAGKCRLGSTCCVFTAAHVLLGTKEDEVAVPVHLPLCRWRSSYLSLSPRGRRQLAVASPLAFSLPEWSRSGRCVSIYYCKVGSAYFVSVHSDSCFHLPSLSFFNLLCVLVKVLPPLTAPLEGLRTRPCEAYYSKYVFLYNCRNF